MYTFVATSRVTSVCGAGKARVNMVSGEHGSGKASDDGMPTTPMRQVLVTTPR